MHKPKWANWLAQDRNGIWNWYKTKPYKNMLYLEWDTDNKWAECDDRNNDENEFWEETLEERLENDN